MFKTSKRDQRLRIMRAWLANIAFVLAMCLLGRGFGESGKECLTSELTGRMGNLMFQHASIMGICTARGLDYKSCAHITNSGWNTWDLPIKEFIQSFNLPLESAATCQIARKRYYREKSFVYDPNILSVQFGTTIQGWLQSWKYFHPHAQKTIKSLYTVSGFQAHKAENFIMNIRKHIPHDFKIIGVHVRVGDKLNNTQNAHFYDQWALSEDYYSKAIALLTARHPRSALVIFSGGGESKDSLTKDRHWAKSKFGGLSNHTYFDHSEDHFIAFKALTLCDSIVVAHSTFSWWAAYLSNTLEIVAPYHIFSAAAEITEGYKMEDYFPPWWSVISKNSSEDRIIGYNPL